MTDDPRVTVPTSNHAIPTGVWIRRELVEALREALVNWRTDKPTRLLVRSVENLLEAAEPKCPKCGIGKLSTSGGRTPLKCIRASCNHVVDAAERPDQGDADDEMCPNCVTPWKCNGPHVPWPPTPVSEPICECNTGMACPRCRYDAADDYCDSCDRPYRCPPVPVSDEAEAEMTEAEEAWLRWMFENADLFNTDRLSFLAGFNAGAAHMADREADAWDAGYVSGYRLAESYLKRPAGTHALPTNPFRLTPDTEGETDE